MKGRRKRVERFNFTDKRNTKPVGYMEIKNQSEKGAELIFYGDIVSNTWQSSWFTEDKCPQDIVDFLGELAKNEELHIYINSGGGSVYGGLAIYNILKRHKGYKTVYIDGLAASIASVIALVGDKVIIPANAQFMIHKPWSSLWEGNADDFRREAAVLDSCQKAITSVYMEHAQPGITEKQITEMMNKETWLTGAQAAEYFQIEPEEKAEIAACASLYFDKYLNLPVCYQARQMDNTKTDYDKIADLAVKKIKQSNRQEMENRKNMILRDLDYI